MRSSTAADDTLHIHSGSLSGQKSHRDTLEDQRASGPASRPEGCWDAGACACMRTCVRTCVLAEVCAQKQAAAETRSRHT